MHCLSVCLSVCHRQLSTKQTTHIQSSLSPHLPAVSPTGHHTLQRQRFACTRCIGNVLLHDNTRCIGNVARAPVLRGRGSVVAEIEKGQAGGEGGVGDGVRYEERCGWQRWETQKTKRNKKSLNRGVVERNRTCPCAAEHARALQGRVVDCCTCCFGAVPAQARLQTARDATTYKIRGIAEE